MAMVTAIMKSIQKKLKTSHKQILVGRLYLFSYFTKLNYIRQKVVVIPEQVMCPVKII